MPGAPNGIPIMSRQGFTDSKVLPAGAVVGIERGCSPIRSDCTWPVARQSVAEREIVDCCLVSRPKMYRPLEIGDCVNVISPHPVSSSAIAICLCEPRPQRNGLPIRVDRSLDVASVEQRVCAFILVFGS